MLLSAITPPQPVAAVYLTYYVLSAMTLLVAGAVWRANPRRAMNYGASLLLLGAGLWLMGYGLIFRFPADAAGFIRATVACFGLVWPSGVFLLRRLERGVETRRESLRATVWAWTLGMVFSALAISPLSIPYDSTWDNPRYGPVWVPLAAVEFLLTIGVVVRLGWVMKSLRGIQRFEAWFFLFGTSVVGFLMGVRFLMRAWTGRAFNPIEPGLLWIAFLCVMVYGIATKRLFRVRSLLLIVVGYGGVALAGLSLLVLCSVPGSQIESAGVGRLVLGGVLMLLVWSLGGRLVGRWLDRRWRRDVEPARRQILKAGEERADRVAGVNPPVELVAEWARARHARLLMPEQEVWRDTADPSVVVAADDALVSHLQQHRWVTRDVLERSWRSTQVEQAEASLRSLDSHVAVMPAVERAGVPLILCVGPRVDGVLYSYDDVQNLMILAETLGTHQVSSGVKTRAQEMGKVQAMEVLGASIGHDIKQHVAVLRMAAGRLAENPRDADLNARFLPLLESELDGLSGYSRRLLSLAEPMPFRSEIVDAATLIRDVAERLQELADNAGVELEVKSSARGVRIEVDPERLREALHNLVRNAVQAFPAGGGRPDAPRVLIRVEHDAAGVGFLVRDNGPGLPEAVLARLFDPFVPTAKSDGHGLGLYIAWDIAVKHGGSLRHHRPNDGGAEFGLTLPASRVRAPS